MYNNKDKEIDADFIKRGVEILDLLNKGSLDPKDVPVEFVHNLCASMIAYGSPPDDLAKLISIPWRDAWYMLDGTWTGFRNDVDAVRRKLNEIDTSLVESGRPAIYLDLEIFCGLILTSIVSFNDKLQGVLELGLMTGLVTEEQVVETASDDKSHYISKLLPLLSKENQARLAKTSFLNLRQDINPYSFARNLEFLGTEYLEQEDFIRSIEIARGFSEPDQKGRTLIVVVDHLEEPLKSDVVTEILECADKEDYPIWRSKMLSAAAAHLTGTDRQEAIAKAVSAARECDEETYKCESLIKILPLLDKKDRPEMVAEIMQLESVLDYEGIAYSTLKDLLIYLDEDQLREAVTIARKRNPAPYNSKNFGIIIRIAKLLPAPECTELIDEAVADFRSLEEKFGVNEDIMPYLTQEELIELVENPSGITACLDGQGGDYLNSDFHYFLTYIKEPEKSRLAKDAFKRITSNPDSGDRAEMLVAIGELYEKLGKKDHGIFKEALDLSEKGEYSFRMDPLRLRITAHLESDEGNKAIQEQEEIKSGPYKGYRVSMEEKFHLGALPFMDREEQIASMVKIIDQQTSWNAAIRPHTFFKLREVLELLPKIDQFALISRILKNDCNGWRRNMFSDMAVFLPVLVDLGGEQVLDGLLKATREIPNWWG
jgi:hypothetical protein